MDLGNNFLSSQKKAAIAKSLLWNVFIDIFKEKKNIDISEKIISVKKNISSFVITINNPLLKQEYIFLENEISEVFHKKLSKM
jgi:hypothetical protein